MPNCLSEWRTSTTKRCHKFWFVLFILTKKLTCEPHFKKLKHTTKNARIAVEKNSKLSLENKILIYESALKVWLNSIELRVWTTKSNIVKMERQSKILRIVTNVN